MMAKESCVVSQTENLDDLLRNLNDQYARIERAISLRSANVEFVKEKYESVNQCFSKVIQLMQSQGAEEIEINSVSKSKLEFDTYVDNWLKSVTITRSKSNLSQISRASSKNTYLSSSTKSSSAKRKEAYAKLVIAKMKQKQADERAVEVAEQARAEAERQRAEAERQRAQEAERKLAEQERIKKEAARELWSWLLLKWTYGKLPPISWNKGMISLNVMLLRLYLELSQAHGATRELINS